MNALKIGNILFVFFIMLSGPAASEQVQATHEVSARVPVTDANFVKARRQAVKKAQKSALEEALRNLMGEKKFLANKKKLRRVLNRPQKYVKSYRFIEAVDDPVEMVSTVLLSVTLYPEAVGRALSNIGVGFGLVNEKSVLVLIRERSFTRPEEAPFWDFLPISETSMLQEFIEAGVQVISRDPILHIVSEETVLQAVKGDMSKAVHIGLQAGADLLVLGNAVSSLLEHNAAEGRSTLQTSISVRVIAVRQSTVIAAKSDFATATDADPMKAELKAFDEVSDKLLKFLMPPLRRYWDKGVVAAQPTRRFTSPLPINDL